MTEIQVGELLLDLALLFALTHRERLHRKGLRRGCKCNDKDDWLYRPPGKNLPIQKRHTTTSCSEFILDAQGKFPYIPTSKKRLLITWS